MKLVLLNLFHRVTVLCLLALLMAAGRQSVFAVPFAVQGPGVDTNNFRVTTFASGLSFPLGMAELSDGSLLVSVCPGGNFFSAPGQLVRLTDTNADGIADDSGTVLYNGLPSTLTAVRAAGRLVLVEGQGKPITILRAGATPADPLTFIGQIIIQYPSGGAWEHSNSALRLRPTPGQTNSYDLLFQLGSDSNFATTTRTAILTNNNVPGATGTMPGDSFYMLTVTDLGGTNVTATNLTQIASGVRNPASFVFQSATGDLYFEDNGIDGLVNGNEPLSADELNYIARTNIGGPAEFFGFPTNYTLYRSNMIVGGAGIQPLINFEPLPDPFTGHESEGANDMTFAPPGFPAGLNSGIFIGFHGRFSSAGTNNEENPVVYADPGTGMYFHFIEGKQPGIGHLDGLMATRDSLFVADLVSTGNAGNGAGAGIIYQIKALTSPLPPTLSVSLVESQIELTWDRGNLQEADNINGPWSNMVDAFSPELIDLTAPQKFYRTRY